MSVRKKMTGLVIAAAIGVVGAAAPTAAFAAGGAGGGDDVAVSSSYVTVGADGAMIYRFPDYNRGADGHILRPGHREYVDCWLESDGFHWWKTHGTNPTYLLKGAATADNPAKIEKCS
jgi:hypothetical protein